MEAESGENEKLLCIASSLKNDAKEMQSRLHTHDLLIEAIDAASAENMKLMREGKQKFDVTVHRIRKDPKNTVILVLVLVAVFLAVYLLKF